MSEANSFLPQPSQRSSWLQQQWRHYTEEPCSFDALLEPALHLYEEQVLAEAPSEFGVRLTLFLCELLLQDRQFEAVAKLVDRAQAWTELDIAMQERVSLLCWQHRIQTFFQRHGDAMVTLTQLSEMTRHSSSPLELALHRRVLAGSLVAQREHVAASAANRALAIGDRPGRRSHGGLGAGPWLGIGGGARGRAQRPGHPTQAG